MIARFTSAGFALLAFSIALLGGIASRNPVEVVLSRGLVAILVFFILGLILGHAAQRVVDEYERDGTRRLRKQYSFDASEGESSMTGTARPTGAQGGAD